MSRHGFHTFTSTAPVFALDDIDPFYQAHPADRAAAIVATTPRDIESRDPLTTPDTFPDTLIAR